VTTYALEPSIFNNIGVSGTITTDGLQGALGFGDITDWSISFMTGLVLTPQNSTLVGLLSSPDLTAGADGLHWNFADPNTQVVEFLSSTPNTNSWFVITDRYYDNPLVFRAQDGYYLATSVPWNGMTTSDLIAVTVPEPAIWALLLLGFMLMGFLTHGRRKEIATSTMG
jgi:hypothetical protein